MALAIIKHFGNNHNRQQFRIDIGKNRYYRYAIGDAETHRRSGVAFLKEPAFVSPLKGPMPESSLGRQLLEIPDNLFDREKRFIQLMSYRSVNGEGPAISPVLKIHGTIADLERLPVLTFGRTNIMQPTEVRNIPFSYQEARYSDAMFWGALLNIAKKALPKIVPMIGGLLGGGKGAGAKNGAAQSPQLQAAGNSDTIKMIMDLITQLTAKTGGETATAKSASNGSKYSEAKIAPAALLAALPALAPLLEKALNPETIKALTENLGPNKLISTITDSLKGLGKLGLDSKKMELEHLRKIHPDIEDPGLDKLLAAMSINLAKDSQADFRRVESVNIEFTGLMPTVIHGRSRIAYRAGEAFAFPIKVDTPRVIGKALLSVVIKQAESLKILAKSTQRLEQIAPGASVSVNFQLEKLSRLQSNEDYLVCASLIWKSKSSEKVGTRKSQLITVIGDYIFDRAATNGDIIPLNDVEKFRHFWHKSWSGDFTPDMRRLLLDCKYYYALDNNADSNARMATELMLGEGSKKRKNGKLKSGMTFSPAVLNHLIPEVSEFPMLTAAQLSALKGSEFADRFNVAARKELKFTGRSGRSAALWHYPELKLQEIILKKAGQVDGSGQITAFIDESVRFPMPVSIHFIGTRSDS